MTTKTRSLLWCLLALALAESGLRQLERQLVPVGGLPPDRPVFLSLGTSRTLRGVIPRVVSEALRDHGVDDPVVANVTVKGRTLIGLYRHYMEVIHPRLDPTLDTRVLAIEVRGGGLNDNYMEQSERRYLRLQAFDAAGLDPGIPTFDAATLAQGLLGQLALSRVRRTLERWRHPEVLDDARWHEGDAGWEPFEGQPPEKLKRSLHRPFFRKTVLADYSLGGVQTTFLRRLIRQAQDDGWTVLLHVLPVTDVHLGFWGPDDRERFRTHLEHVARDEGVALFDLRDQHGLPHEDFWDTHHLGTSGAQAYSRRLGEALGQLDDAGR